MKVFKKVNLFRKRIQKPIFIAGFGLIGTVNLAYALYDDHPIVKKLVGSGDPIISHESSSCEQRFRSDSLTDRLGKTKGDDALCVQHLELPNSVLREVILMAEYETENSSDYDRRVTRLYTFRHETFRPSTGVSTREVVKLAKSLGIPSSQIKGIDFSSFHADKDSFGQFDGLYVGDHYRDDTAVSRYIKNQFDGQTVLVVTFGDGVDLYPGGGFAVTHTIIFTEGIVTYVKLSWWDA